MRTLTLILTLVASTAAMGQVTLMAQKFQRLNDPIVKTRSEDRLTLDIAHEGHFLLLDDTDTKFDSSFRVYLDDQEINYSLSEAFLTSTDGTNTWAVGRKILNWNPNETFWGLNHLNARRSFTLLDDKREGLMGFHWDRRMGDLKLNFILSYAYIPQLNPGLKVKDGAVVSKSEWVRRPPTRTVVNEQEVDIYYRLYDPEIKDVILKKTLGLNLDWNWSQKESAGKFNSYALYKPENSLRINAQAYYDLDLKQVIVEADPVVNHHAVLGMGVEQRLPVQLPGQTSVAANFEVIDPNVRLGKDFDVLDPIKMRQQNREFESEFFTIKPNYKRESHVTFALNHRNYFYDIGINYFRLLTEASSGDDFYSDSSRWENALGLWLQVRPSEQLTWLIDVKYDFARTDVILRTEAAYHFSDNLLAGLGLEVLRAPKARSFWANYRTNDSVYMSFGYVF